MNDTELRAADLLKANLVDRALMRLVETLLMCIAGALILLVTVAVSHIKPWMFANPPPEACRPAGQRVTPQTQHLQPCPAERRKETT